jgi:predicted O-methyltransferase YrrM
MMNIDKEIKQYGLENKVPITKDDTLCFLLEIINKNDCKQILEIGTAIGFGCITIAQNSNCEHIDTVEIDMERFKPNFANGLLTIEIYVKEKEDEDDVLNITID